LLYIYGFEKISLIKLLSGFLVLTKSGLLDLVDGYAKPFFCPISAFV